MAEKTRPNILWIFPDEHRGAAMSCAGDPNVETPNLDRLAEQGVRFANAYTNNPLCSPFRASLFTGQYCTTHGVISNHRPLLPNQPVLAELLQHAGYHTSYMGKWHISGGCFGHHFVSPWYRPGWDDWLGWENSNVHFDFEYSVGNSPRVRTADGYMTDWLTDRTIEWLDAHATARPWFHVLSIEPPHPPCVAPQPYMDACRDRPLTFRPNFPTDCPQAEGFERQLRGYYAQIENIDDNVGRIIAALERTGQLDDTIVFYFSDHGDLMGSHGRMNKERPEQESTNIPLIVRHPALVQPGRTSEALISGVDIMPTLLGLLDLPVPETVQGTDLSSTLRGRDDAGAPFAYIQYEHCIFPEDPALVWRALRTGPWTCTHTLTGGPAQLFDLDADPYQLTNLVDSPAHRQVLQDLGRQMRHVADTIGDDFFTRAEGRASASTDRGAS